MRRHSRTVVTAVAAVAVLLGGCSGAPRASLSSTPPSASTTQTTANTNDATEALAVWRGRVADHSVSYLAIISCSNCEAKGQYRFSERAGTVTDVAPVGTTPPLRNRDQWSLSTILNIAADANGKVTVHVGANDGSITLTVDVDPATTGDEFTYTAMAIDVR
ncbi:MAG: hypothetical protein WCI22_00600 [Actinomycetota bacterium]